MNEDEVTQEVEEPTGTYRDAEGRPFEPSPGETPPADEVSEVLERSGGYGEEPPEDFDPDGELDPETEAAIAETLPEETDGDDAPSAED